MCRRRGEDRLVTGQEPSTSAKQASTATQTDHHAELPHAPPPRPSSPEAVRAARSAPLYGPWAHHDGGFFAADSRYWRYESHEAPTLQSQPRRSRCAGCDGRLCASPTSFMPSAAVRTERTIPTGSWRGTVGGRETGDAQGEELGTANLTITPDGQFTLDQTFSNMQGPQHHARDRNRASGARSDRSRWPHRHSGSAQGRAVRRDPAAARRCPLRKQRRLVPRVKVGTSIELGRLS